MSIRSWSGVCLFLAIGLSCVSHALGAEPVLENSFLQISFDAKNVGAVETVEYKPASVRFTRANINEAAVFQDGRTVAITGFKPAGSAPSALSAAFETALPPNPLIGSRPGNQTEFPYFRHDDTTRLHLTKTYRLPPDEPVCEIRYEVRNTGAKPITFCLRLNRQFGLEKVRLETLVPTVEGVLPVRSGHYYDVPAAWTALVGSSLAIVSGYDWRKTSCLFATGAVTTETTLAPGATWRTTTRVHFFTGLDSVAGLTDGTAGDLVFPPPPDVPIRDPNRKTIEDEFAEAVDDLDDNAEAAPVPTGLDTTPTRKAFLAGKPISYKVRVASARRRKLSLKGTASLHLKSRNADLGTAQLSVTPAESAVASLTFVPPAPGTWILRFDVTEDGKPVGSFEESLVVDYPTGFYMPGLAREGEKVGNEFDRYRIERFRHPSKYDQHSIAFGMTDEIQDPHVTYANPLSGGPLRALVTIPFRRSREAIEVKLRLAMEMDCLVVGGHGYRALPGALKKEKPKTKPRAPDDETLAMKKFLNRQPELIFMAATFWDWFYPDIQEEIIRQVREDGAALVLYPAADTTVALAQLVEDRRKKGRVAFLEGRMAFGPDPIFWGLESDIEELSHKLIRIARGDPPVKMTWDASDAVAREYHMNLVNHADEKFRGQLELVAYFNLPKTFPKAYASSPYSDYDEVARAVVRASLEGKEQKELTIPFPNVPTGQYRTFLVLKDSAGGTIDWLSRDQAAESPLLMENLVVSHVAGERLRLERTDEIKIEYELKPRQSAPPKEPADGPPPEPQLGKLVAYIFGEDRSQRIVVRQSREVKLKDGKAAVAFRASLARALHRLFILRIGVKADGLVVAEERVPVLVGREPGREHKYCFTVLDNEDSFSFTHTQLDDQVQAWDPMPWAWIDMRGYVFGGYTNDPFALSAQAWEKLERKRNYEEFKKTLPKGPQAELKEKDEEAEEADDLEELIEDEAEQERVAKLPKKEPEKKVFVRSPCYNNPKLREAQFARACAAARECSTGWPQRILIVDEYVYGPQNACQCEYCQPAFRRYLRRSYGTLARLSKGWGAQLKTWDDATLYDFDNEPKPPPRKQWPRALDTLTYKTVSLTDFSEALRDEARKIDPEIEFGFSGCYKMDIFNGTEFWLMSQVGNFHLVYRDTEEWQSFVGSGNAHSWSSGYGRNYNPSQQKHLPWTYLFRGQWRLGHFTSQGYPMAGPDSRLHPGPKRFFEALDEIHRGYDELLLGHEVRDPIAIHWSGPSFFLCGIEQWCKTGDASKAGDIQRWCTHSVPRFGMRPYYLSYGRLEQGDLGFWGPPKVIFLQYSNAMSRKECETLRRFVADGGLLVGGVDTATRTEHGCPYDTPPLDDVFGVRHTEKFQDVIQRKDDNDHTNDVTLTLPDDDAAMTFNPWVVGPPGIEATTAKAYGRWGTEEHGGRVFFVNRYQKGTAIYLNFPLLNINPNERARIVKWIYDYVKVAPFAEASGCKLSRFRDGEAFYACLELGYGFPPEYYENRSKECEVRLREARHVYDARQGKYLGKTERFQPEFADHSIAIYSCLPYRVRAVNVTPPREAKPGGILRCAAEIEIDAANPVRHILRVDVSQPDGTRRNLLGYNLIMQDGKGTVEIPLAFNAPCGQWRLHVRDVATGTQKELPFTVTPHSAK